MRPIKIIDIPDPCRQSWHDMKATAEGRYCNSCEKTVIDFTVMTNKEIITFLASRSNICGRLYSSQMESINTSVRSNKNSFSGKTLIAAISLISVFNQVKAESKIIQAVEQRANSDIHKRPTHKTLHGRCLTSAQIHDELPIRQLPHQGENNILFSSQTEILGGVVRCIAIVQRPPLYKRIWWQIKKVF
jgi:hypothetical protein